MLRFRLLMKVMNTSTEFYLQKDALENMYVNVACRLGLVDTFCCLQVLFKTF